MELHIVEQATGSHGWTSFEAYINGAFELGYSVSVYRPKASWGASEVDSDDGLFELLKKEKDEVILFCGFDWHSQPLHNDIKFKSLVNKWIGPKVGLFQEHISADWIQSSFRNKKEFEEAVFSACECLTHVVCNHEEDVGYLKKLGIKVHCIFLPFAADLSVIKSRTPFSNRLNKAFFKGKRALECTNNPYAYRENILDLLMQHQDVAEVQWFDCLEYQSRKMMIQDYVSNLNLYKIQLNLPSVSSSLTCRPFEIMATGGLLLQSYVVGELSKRIVPESLYVCFDYKSPTSVIDAIRSSVIDVCRMESVSKISQNYVNQKHSSKVRVDQILKWVANSKKDSMIYDELSFESKPKLIGLEMVGDKIMATEPKILVDLVFYKYADSGIAVVWNRLLKRWAELNFSKYIILLVREGSRFSVPKDILEQYEYIVKNIDSNDESSSLQNICNDFNITLFVSTYYTKPTFTKSILLVHDCIPEFINPDFKSDNEWKSKAEAIDYSDAYLCISQNTANELIEYYQDSVLEKNVYVAKNEFDDRFKPQDIHTINKFKKKYNIDRPYIIFVGERRGYKGYKNFEMISECFKDVAVRRPDIASKYMLVYIGGGDYNDELQIEEAFDKNLYKWEIKRLTLEESEVPIAYSAADLNIYPSLAEGFGLPPGESILCGTRSIVWKNSINNEIYGDLVEYLDASSSLSLTEQLCKYIDGNSDCEKLIDKRDRLLALQESNGQSTQAGTFLEILLLYAQITLDVNNKSYNPILFDCFYAQRRDWLNRLINSHPNIINSNKYDTDESIYKASAIVSTYNGDEFFSGCLVDLVGQTLMDSGEMEVLVIDSASPGDESSVFKNYTHKTNIFYIRTVERESLYRAWNRGAKYSRSKYLSNSNIDDRHRIDFFERLSEYLDNDDTVQLTYPAQYMSLLPNENFSEYIPNRSWGWPDYSLNQLKIGNHVGSQPMWRRSLHNTIGYFNESYRVAGDYEFWLRIATHAGPLKLYPVHIGLFYFNGYGIEHSNPLRSEIEVSEICEKYGINKNYSVSESDIKRGDNTSSGPRKIEDLQYSGIEITNSINFVVATDNNISNLNDIIFPILSQSVSINHRLNIQIVNETWNDELIDEINSEFLNIMPTLKASNSLVLDNSFDIESCTCYIFEKFNDNKFVERNIVNLYHNESRCVLELKNQETVFGYISKNAYFLKGGVYDHM